MPVTVNTTPEDKKMAEAWELLKEHVNYLHKSPAWSHKLVTEVWAKDEMKMPKPSKGFVHWKPSVIMCETAPSQVLTDEGLWVQLPGSMRALINDVWSYDVRADVVPPNYLKITGEHIAPIWAGRETTY